MGQALLGPARFIQRHKCTIRFRTGLARVNIDVTNKYNYYTNLCNNSGLNWDNNRSIWLCRVLGPGCRV